MKEIERPCDELNCKPFVFCDYDPKKPASQFCIGFRTGVIKGKEKAIEGTPEDVFVSCILIGSHSESCGRHTSVLNLADFYLQFRNLFRALHEVGQLKRTIRAVLVSSSEDVEKDIEDAIASRAARRVHRLDVGTKFVEFMCSCGETFFREYKYENDGKYYRPDKKDKLLFQLHRDLGHTVSYRKCKMVKRSRVGNNKMWQEWGPYEYEG